MAACTTTSPADPMAVYYLNTVLVTQPYGETDRILINPDHTYTMYGVRYSEGRGVWDIENNQVCLMPGDTPATAGQKFCNNWGGVRVGDHWTIVVAGQDIPMQIAPGRLGPIERQP